MLDTTVSFSHNVQCIERMKAVTVNTKAAVSVLTRHAIGRVEQCIRFSDVRFARVGYLERPKIVYPIIANECRFTLDTNGFFVNDKSFALIGILATGVSSIAAAALVGMVGGYLLGVPGGWLVGVCVGPFLPKPPPDGYVEQTEQEFPTTEVLTQASIDVFAISRQAAA